MRTITLLGTFHPSKKIHVKDMKSLYDRYPCEVCKFCHRHQDLETGKWQQCKFRQNMCWKMGNCKHFERAGETRAEAEQWRKVETWK